MRKQLLFTLWSTATAEMFVIEDTSRHGFGFRGKGKGEIGLYMEVQGLHSKALSSGFRVRMEGLGLPGDLED